MSSDTAKPHLSAAGAKERPAEQADALALAAIREGPRGALVLAGVSVGLLFIGWLAFYFLLFLPRGAVG